MPETGRNFAREKADRWGARAGLKITSIASLSLSVLALETVAQAQDCAETPDGRVCRIQQPIVEGEEVDVDLQRRLGLVTVNGGCSGTLLNRYWVLTARHCVTRNPPVPGSARTVDDQNDVSDPLLPADRVSVTATWAPERIGLASRIHDFTRNANALAADVDTTDVLDIVLIYLGTSDLGLVDNQRIYAIGREMGPRSVRLGGRLTTEDTVTQYGRGYSTYAAGVFGTPSAQQAQGLGTYRSARLTPSNITETHYDLAMNASNQVGHGGDSGGPSVVTVGGFGVGIAGVQSTCVPTGYIPNAPARWQWATGISFCTYVSTEPFMGEIIDTIKETPECSIGPACAIPAIVNAAMRSAD